LAQADDDLELIAPEQPALRWRAADRAAFDMRQWDGEVVLYVLASGETHALPPSHSASFLTLLEQAPVAQPAAYWLVALSAGEVPDGSPAGPGAHDDADLAVLTGVLNDLHGIGVVERLPA
jgi:hypothetical protein